MTCYQSKLKQEFERHRFAYLFLSRRKNPISQTIESFNVQFGKISRLFDNNSEYNSYRIGTIALLDKKYSLAAINEHLHRGLNLIARSRVRKPTFSQHKIVKLSLRFRRFNFTLRIRGEKKIRRLR